MVSIRSIIYNSNTSGERCNQIIRISRFFGYLFTLGYCNSFLLYHLRQWLIYKRSTNVENLLLTSSKLESLLNIEVYQRRYSKYEECYFMENDIYAIVKSQFSLFIWKLLCFGDINNLTKAIGNKLIAELIKKKL